MLETISNLRPQQVFLVQGTHDAFQAFGNTLATETSFPELHDLSRFTIDDARTLISFVEERGSTLAWYACYFDVFSGDSAQALLKVLEEPTPGVNIVFFTPHPYLVPLTIRSRARLLFSETTEHRIPELFSTKEKIKAYIADVIADEDREASERRALGARLLDILELHIKNDPHKVRHLYEAKEMLYKANMPTKQVIEYAVTMVM